MPAIIHQRSYRRHSAALAVLLLALLLPIFAPSARVARALGPIVVNTADGRLDDLDNSKCTLLEAVQAANTDVAVRGCSAGSGPVPDLITFSVPGVIKLKQTANINSNIAMLGRSRSAATAPAGSSRSTPTARSASA